MLTEQNLDKLFGIFYNSSYFEFSKHMFIGHHDDYVFDMWEAFRGSPTGFWARLDDNNKQVFLDWVNGVA